MSYTAVIVNYTTTPNSMFVSMEIFNKVYMIFIQCIVIEDALAGVQAAKAAGMR